MQAAEVIGSVHLGGEEKKRQVRQEGAQQDCLVLVQVIASQCGEGKKGRGTAALRCRVFPYGSMK